MGLRFKLFIPTLFLLAMVSLLIHFFWLPNYYDSAVEKQLDYERAYIQLLSDAAVSDLLANDLAKVNSMLDRVINSRDNWHAIKLYLINERRIYPLQEKPLPDDIKLELIQHTIRFNDRNIANIEVWIDLKSLIVENIKHVRYLEQLLLSLLLGASLIALLFQDRFIRNPLKRLATHAGEIASGNYDNKFKHHSKDEIGKLADSFNSMRKQISLREKELHGSEARYRAVIDNAADSIITINDKGIVVACNIATEKIFGYSGDEVLGQNLKMLIPEPYHGEYDSFLNIFIATGKKYITSTGRQVKGLHKDGTIFPLELAVNEIEVNGERLFIGITRDITKRVHDEKISLNYSMSLEQLQSIASNPELKFDQKIIALLKLGQKIFSLPLAIFSQVIGERYIIKYSAGPDGTPEPGTEFPLGDTYCCHTLAADGSTGFHHASESLIKNHPCYKKFGLEAYIGAPIYVNNKLYGTLNFSSPESRKEPFTSADESIILLFAQWIGTEMARVMAETELEKLSRTDGLTGLANRRHFDETLSHEINRAIRSHSKLTLIICDIDYFKNYNDTYGHPAGDLCIQRVTKAISSSFSRAGELVARYGGEEFAIIISDTDDEKALKLAEEIRNNVIGLNLAHETSDVAPHITISVGVATLTPSQSTTMSVLIELADNALYQAKEKGRNNVQVSS